jgi:hypothetical protein
MAIDLRWEITPLEELVLLLTVTLSKVISISLSLCLAKVKVSHLVLAEELIPKSLWRDRLKKLISSQGQGLITNKKEISIR